MQTHNPCQCFFCHSFNSLYFVVVTQQTVVNAVDGEWTHVSERNPYTLAGSGLICGVLLIFLRSMVEDRHMKWLRKEFPNPQAELGDCRYPDAMIGFEAVKRVYEEQRFRQEEALLRRFPDV